MADISTWSATAGDNDAAPPDGAPEGMAPSTVNNVMREIMAAIRRWYEDAEWLDFGHTPTRTDNDSFTIPTDVTGTYTVGRRLKLSDSSTLYGTIAASSYSDPDTTIDVTMDSGTLSASLSAVAVGIIDPTTAASSTAMQDLVDDTTPQLGGALDTNAKAVNFSEGAAVASATSPNIWAGDGNTIHITGTTTISDFADAPRIGAWRCLIFDDALTFTTGSGITIAGGLNVTTAAGDMALVYADAVDAFRAWYLPVANSPAAPSQAEAEAGTATVPRPWTAERVAQAIAALATGGAAYDSTSTPTGVGTVTFSSIPAAVNRLEISWAGISGAAGSYEVTLRLGDSGGSETTGYLSIHGRIDGSGTANAVATTDRVRLSDSNLGASNVSHGRLTIERVTGNTWAYSGVVYNSISTQAIMVAGSAATSAVLDRVEFYLSSGNFDAGSVTVRGYA